MPDVLDMPSAKSVDLKRTPRKRESLTSIPLDRTPPHDTAAEQGLEQFSMMDLVEFCVFVYFFFDFENQ